LSATLPPDLVFLQWLIDQCGYKHPRPLPGGRYAAIWRLAFTHAIIVGRIGDRAGYDDRWCFNTYAEALIALEAWDGQGEPIGWIRHPNSGRRVSESPNEMDDNGKRVGAIGVSYVSK
jgi:hypothetical protein